MGRDNAGNSKRWRAKQGKTYKKAECERVKKAYVPMKLKSPKEQEKIRERGRLSMAKTRAKRKAAESKQDDDNSIAEHPNVDPPPPLFLDPRTPLLNKVTDPEKERRLMTL